MRKISIDGKEIITNYGEKSAERLVSNNDLPNYEIRYKKSKEGNKEFLMRLVNEGYTRIRFVEISTNIKGFHEIAAYCR